MARLALLLVAVVVGCSSSSAPPAAGPGGGAGGFNVTYSIQGDGSVMNGMCESGRFTSDGGTLEIKDKRLWVNGKDHGPLASGDAVEFGKDGTVTVNGEKRTPQ